MPTRAGLRFVHKQVAWMLVVIVALVAFETLTLELFFSVSFLGFLLLTEYTNPFNVRPRWRARLRWLIVLGLLGFGYVVFRQFRAVAGGP